MTPFPTTHFPPRFRERADRAAKAFMRKIGNMRQRDLSRHVLSTLTPSVGAEIRLIYSASGSFASVRAVLPDSTARDNDQEIIAIAVDTPEKSASLLRVEMYVAHAMTMIRRRAGERPFLTAPDAEIAAVANDVIALFVLREAIGRDGDEDMVHLEACTRLASDEIDARIGESNHARLERLAAMREAPE